jgi:hypothetical protein
LDQLFEQGLLDQRVLPSATPIATKPAASNPAIMRLSICSIVLFPCDLTGSLSTNLDTNYRNQRQTQGIETTQQTLQSSLVEGASKDSDRGTIALACDRNRHSSSPF